MKHLSTKRYAPKNKGFIALISAIIISTILVGLLLTSAGNGLSARIDGLDRELKEQSENLAQSCTDTALLSIAENYTYVPKVIGDIIAVGTDTCTIDSVTYGIENTTTHEKTATIHTHATFHGTWTTLIVTTTVRSPLFAHDPTLPTISVISSEEI